MKNRQIASAIAIAGTMLALSQPAAAQSSDTTMLVDALVLENCTVVATPMSFGPITDVGAADVDTTATLTLACTANADYEIQLDDGLNASSGQRRLANAGGTEFLNYDIYRTAARTAGDRWGNTIGSDTQTGTADTLGVAILTAYGRIPAGVSKVSAGSYSDTITVTVNF